jgi:hypothetical protein
MQRKITLRVLGVDLDDEDTVAIIAADLDDLAWSMVDGRVRATLFVDQVNLVNKTVETARCIEHKLTARVDQVDEDLVGIPDIAARVKINRETVRSWANGTRGPRGFPVPVGAVGGGERGSAKVWKWREVNDWLDRHYSLGDGYSYPTLAEVAEINAYLAHAEYMLVAALQNGPPAINSFVFTQLVNVRESDSFNTASEGPTGMIFAPQSLVIEARL